jgi:TonB family protein
MKRLLFLALLSCTGSYAQDTLTTYYDAEWRTSDKEQARYYRKTVFKDGLWFVDQYNLDGNYLELSGSYKVIDTIKEGRFTAYYKNGFKNEEGDYSDHVQVGKWTTWHDNGKINSEEIFLSNMKDIIAVVQQDSLMLSSYKSANLRYGYNGIRNGECNWYHRNGRMSTKELYKNGRIISAEFWDEQGNSQQIEVVNFYDNSTMPQYKGKDVSAFIATNLQYPKEAIKQGIQGRVVIQFAVDVDGTIVDYEIKKSLGSKEIDAEAIRVVRLLNHQFKPGISHNRVTKMYFALPIRFSHNNGLQNN